MIYIILNKWALKTKKSCEAETKTLEERLYLNTESLKNLQNFIWTKRQEQTIKLFYWRTKNDKLTNKKNLQCLVFSSCFQSCSCITINVNRKTSFILGFFFFLTLKLFIACNTRGLTGVSCCGKEELLNAWLPKPTSDDFRNAWLPMLQHPV